MLLILAAVCVAAVIWSRQQSPPPPAPATAATPASATPETSGELRFESSPPGAQVVGPGGDLGVTPFTWPLKGKVRPKSVMFRLEGYFTQQRNIAPDAEVISAKMLPR